MRFEITILGNGSAMPTAGRNHSGQVINLHEQFYLVDCGEGTQLRMRQYGVSIMRLNAIFISHLHGDHLYGLFPLLDSLNMLGRKTPLQLFAPAPIKELLDAISKYIPDNRGYSVEVVEVDARANEMVYENKVMEVWTIPLRHRIPSVGYLFREKMPPLNVDKGKIEKYMLGVKQIMGAKRGRDVELEDGTIISNSELTYRPYQPRSYAYCSDTSRSGKVTKLVEGVDLLYHEATFLEEETRIARQTGHTTATQAGEVAEKAGVGKLMIGHFSGRYKDIETLLREAQATFSNTIVAIEGETVEIPIKKEESKGSLLDGEG